MYSNGYKYRKLFTIDNTKLASGTINNFQVLLNHTDADLKTVANGGKVRMNKVLDIRFERASDNTKLFHEIVEYTPTTGAIEAYVQMPSLSSTGTNTFYMYYGKDLSQDTYNGIKWGIGSAEVFNIKKNWFTNASNIGEITPYALNVKDFDGNTLDVGSTKVVAMAEDGTSHIGNESTFPNGISGFLMWTSATTQTRFGVADATWNPSLISVFREGGQWWYDNNGVFGTFTPVSSDILVAMMRWNANTGGDYTRMVDYAQVIYAGESEPSSTWTNGYSTYDPYGFGAMVHDHRLVGHMNKTINTGPDWFESPEATVFANVGTSMDMSTAALVTGKVGKAYDFDGFNDKIRIDSATVIHDHGNQSTSMWIKWDTMAGNQCILGRRTGISDASAYMWWTIGGTFNVDLSGSASRWNTGWNPTAGVWYHVAVVIDASQCRLYVNSNLQASLGIGGTHGFGSGSPTYFGASLDAGAFNNFFNGQIDEVRFHAQTLPAAWYKAEYNNQNSPTTFYTIGNEGTAVDVALANHTLESPEVLLAQAHLVAMQSASHDHTVTSPSITQLHNLLTASVTHDITSENISMVQNMNLVLADAIHNVYGDNIQLFTGFVVQADNSTHVLVTDNVNLKYAQVIELSNALHGHTADNVQITTSMLLGVPSAAKHSLINGALILGQSYVIGVEDAVHAVLSGELRIINWDELGVGFGLYKPDYSNTGTLNTEDIDSGVISPAFPSTGGFEHTDIDDGNFIPTYIKTGKF